MGFFSSIKRLWSSNKTAETPETPQVPAEEALAAQPAETEDGASHEESSVSDAPQSPVEVLEKLSETAAAEQQQADLEMDQLAAGQSLEPDGQAPAPAAAAQPAPQPDAPKEPSGWRDTLLLTLREAEPRLSVWLSIALEDLGPDARTGDELWERVRFLLTALGAPENEADAFVADFAAWAARMEYEEVADFRSELQYRLALALDLEDEEDERNRIFLKLHQGLERTREQLGKGSPPSSPATATCPPTSGTNWKNSSLWRTWASKPRPSCANASSPARVPLPRPLPRNFALSSPRSWKTFSASRAASSRSTRPRSF